MIAMLSPNSEHIQYPPLYARNFATVGKRLVIIGTSIVDGETEEEKESSLYNPVAVLNPRMARELFGSGPLLKAYEDTLTYNEDILVYLMRIEEYSHEHVFSVLEVFEFDLLYMDNVFFDKDFDLLKMFINFAEIKAEKGNLVHGIVGLSKDKNYPNIKPLLKDISKFADDCGDEPVEYGRYISIVYNQGEFKDAGAVYAGILAQLEPKVSPINKTIPDFTLSMELKKDEIKALQAAGVVCFRNTFKKGVTCASSSCAVSTAGSVHKHIANFRIAQFLINRISEELQIFVGRPHLAFQLANVRAVVDSVCRTAISDEIIKDYQYTIASNELKGIISLDVECVPVFSVYAITTHTQVRVFT